MMPFQNCGMQSSFVHNFSLSSISKSGLSGNGGGYEGKPDGTYYRFIPSYTCEGKPAADQITEIRNGQAYLYENKDNQCANQSAPVAVADINLSPFQKEFISVKDSLFKRYDEKPVGIPNNIAEILCRDDFNNPNFEIISHYDREKNEALTRIYLPGQTISDFSVSRILSMNEVQYVANDISFKVDLAKPTFAERKFAGQITKSTVPGISTQPLVCVVGGSLDTSKWSLKAVTTADAGSFQLLGNNEILFFSEMSRQYYDSQFYTSINHLFKIGVDDVISDFSKAVFGESYNVITRHGQIDDRLYFFDAQSASEGWSSLFFYDARTGTSKKLTNLDPHADPEQYTSATPILTADQHLIFDTQVLKNFMSNILTVRVYDFNDDSIHDVAVLGDMSKGFYSVLPKLNKVVSYWSSKDGINNVLEIYDTKSRLSKKIPLQIPGTCHFSYNVQNLNDESGFITTEVCDGVKSSLVQVSLNDGVVQVIADGVNLAWISDDHFRIVMNDASNNNIAYDFRTGKYTKLPINTRFGTETSELVDLDILRSSSKMALANDRLLYGFGAAIDKPTLYQVDLQSGVSTAVCEAAVGKKLFVGILVNQKVFLFTYDSMLKVYRFYQVKSPTDCPRINEFPSEYQNVSSLLPTNIGFGLLLGNKLTRDSNQTAAEAVFVPIDGRPPLKFNPNGTGYWNMEVSPDKNKIVLRGPGLNNVMTIFSFDL